jgi:hypothetical protein
MKVKDGKKHKVKVREGGNKGFHGSHMWLEELDEFERSIKDPPWYPLLSRPQEAGKEHTMLYLAQPLTLGIHSITTHMKKWIYSRKITPSNFLMTSSIQSCVGYADFWVKLIHEVTSLWTNFVCSLVSHKH